MTSIPSDQLPSQRPVRHSTNARKRRAQISLTPLIDVVFILLVFFMLASSFLDWKSIELTAPTKASASSGMEGSLLIDILPSGLRLSGEPLTLDQLVERISKRLQKKPEQRILIKPANGVTLQEAIIILDRISSTGTKNISLIRDPGQ